jgi:hypothetical protein
MVQPAQTAVKRRFRPRLRDTSGCRSKGGLTMAKGQQRSNKEAKKPKKDSGPPKTVAPIGLSAPITTVVPDRSKKKK